MKRCYYKQVSDLFILLGGPKNHDGFIFIKAENRLNCFERIDKSNVGKFMSFTCKSIDK